MRADHVATGSGGSTPRDDRPAAVPRVVLADRGDALVGHLSAAVRRRFEVVARVDAELSTSERLLVAGTTIRGSRRRWVERFYKSNLAVDLRSRHVARSLPLVPSAYDVVLQTHCLFEVADPRVALYVDCTHRQAAEQWPDWNPLRGAALRRWYAREHRQYAAAAHLFAFSQQTRDSLVDAYGVAPERVTAVGAGVNFETLPEQADAPRPAAPTVLFVGNDFERKGGPELLRAFALVRREVPDARLQIVGTPHDVPPQPGVELLGRVATRTAMSALYRGASVFCLPSHFDPFPLVTLEAMAHELPVVGSCTAGMPEMVLDGGTGVLVPDAPRDVEALAKALVVLLRDPRLARQLGAAGRRRVEERFLWDHVIDRMAPALEAMAPIAVAGTARPTREGDDR